MLFRQSMAMNDKVLPPEHINRATPMISLGRLLTAQGRTREALPLLRTAYDIRQNKLGPDNRQSALAANALAECLIAKGEFDHAGTLLNSSLAFFKKDKNPHDLKNTRALLARLPK
ncbi:MAG TPA: tetratricopeptide repeat protein [Caldithrix abyssi]|uniref:Tetratricopeptide repeat protein n=1 Tax=Caldithrix abyssi TaxID=187145 RepID=A0A7V1LPZ4_CALAY|nr:tetratricopeptide repeat protein [Caldithrix abyssi]